MLWSKQLAIASLLCAAAVAWADDSALWKEYGLVHQDVVHQGKLTVTRYRMRDLTGALAAWEWRRSPGAKTCTVASFCTSDGQRTVIASDNYLLQFEGGAPQREQVKIVVDGLPEKRDTSLPAILTFLPSEGRVPNSARYITGPQSLRQFAPELLGAKPGFEQGAEAQVADYRIPKAHDAIRLALFYYPTPEMARLHTVNFKTSVGPNVKRSSVLVALVPGSVPTEAADRLLSRVGYEARITWNESPPPSPVKPLYKLLRDILYMSALLSAVCLTAGLLYAANRLYRRRYGSLEADESMTVLKLTD